MEALRSVDDLFEKKAAQRSAAAKVRVEVHKAACETAGARLADIGLAFADIAPDAVISAYYPYKSEINVLSLLERLHAEGRRLALPVVVAPEMPLVFRPWSPGDELETSSLNILEPPASAGQVEPDVLLVPLLAFDRHGYRLGYGGGFYDRTLQRLRSMKRITAIGVAYAGQRVDDVVRGADDQPVDWILTEDGPLRPEPA